MSPALLIFVVTYLLISVQRIPGLRLTRPTASLLGAVAMVLLGGLSLREAYAAIDLDVLVFLLGIMLVVAYLEVGGFFEWCAGWLLRRARTPARLLLLVLAGAAALSAVCVNDAVCLMLTPVLLLALDPLGQHPVPYLVALAMGANIGSALTFAGNPQNMLIGVWSGIGFGRFSLDMLPVVLGALVLAYAVLRLVFRRELKPPFRAPPAVTHPPVDRWVVGVALTVLAGAVAAWLAGASLPLAAITAGAVVVAVARRHPAAAMERVDWPLLLFFAALFVVMRGLEYSGSLHWIDAEGARAIRLGGRWTTVGVVSGVMLLLSNLISNVPAVILWRQVVPTLPDARLVWESMAMSATFAGNLLLMGSMANLLVAERAAQRGVRLGWWDYARAGIPVTLLTLAWGILVLGVRGG